MLAQLLQAPACCELLTIGRLQWLATRAEGSIPIRHGILKLLFFDLVKCSRLCVACGRRKRCMFRRLELCSTTSCIFQYRGVPFRSKSCHASSCPSCLPRWLPPSVSIQQRILEAPSRVLHFCSVRLLGSDCLKSQCICHHLQKIDMATTTGRAYSGSPHVLKGVCPMAWNFNTLFFDL